MPGNHSSACKLYQYDLIYQEARRLHHLSWSYQSTKPKSLFLCLVHHFPNYFSCVPFPDEFFYSLPTKSSMQSACPSIIPLVHYLLPEHKPRICLAVVLVAWRLFQSRRAFQLPNLGAWCCLRSSGVSKPPIRADNTKSMGDLYCFQVAGREMQNL